ncbi:dihydrolipoyl dehydrogenase [[Mycoplasma] gypis]|uniref:Dihydrolipoyl dehydrogenase n=1 Tax=[Mycoplasma] gypis TaxID=92404 RepID=A0ABZ2RQT9_9BACT|nr:dihydrolipoyl dehydrogenase [[Mycoplasma] gypis]MBN0919613.1 dihydrolipoyl dehydrogenase [[Mycoplasma] gypis]
MSTKYNGPVDAEYDLIVIGAGPGGYLAAEEAGKHGLKTLIVERQYWGGVCLNVGCIPTKALLHATEEYNKVVKNSLASLGVNIDLSSVKLDWEKMNAQKTATVNKLTSGVKMLMKGSKVDAIEAEAEFVGSHEVKVDGKVYRGKYMIYGMGSHSRRLSLPGFEEGYKSGKVVTSTGLINFNRVPESLVIIGGGVIGVEFAQVFSAVGTKVTIIQNLDRILFNLDKDVTDEVTKRLKMNGVEFLFNSTTKALEGDEVVYEQDGQELRVKADVVLSAIGRVPNTMKLEATGVELGQRQEIKVNSKCETNVENVYAIGDITNQNMLAHVAYKHAVIAVYDILRKEGKVELDIHYNPLTVPGCIYTDPEVASVGLTENAAKDKGLNYMAAKYSFGFVGKAIAAHRDYGFAKLIVNKEDGKLLGAELVGANSTDMISEIAMAMDHNMTVFDVANVIHPHPTFSEIIWETARQAVHKLGK